MFPVCTADHNCCGVAETFFACRTCPEEEYARDAAGAGATAAWLAPSGCSAFTGCGVADGDAVRFIRSLEDAPGVCGLCLCGAPVGAATETVCSPLDCAAPFALVVVRAGLPGFVPLACRKASSTVCFRVGVGMITTAHMAEPTNTPRRNCQRICARCRSIGTSCMLGISGQAASRSPRRHPLACHASAEPMR